MSYILHKYRRFLVELCCLQNRHLIWVLFCKNTINISHTFQGIQTNGLNQTCLENCICCTRHVMPSFFFSFFLPRKLSIWCTPRAILVTTSKRLIWLASIPLPEHQLRRFFHAVQVEAHIHGSDRDWGPTSAFTSATGQQCANITHVTQKSANKHSTLPHANPCQRSAWNRTTIFHHFASRHKFLAPARRLHPAASWVE